MERFVSDFGGRRRGIGEDLGREGPEGSGLRRREQRVPDSDEREDLSQRGGPPQDLDKHLKQEPQEPEHRAPCTCRPARERRGERVGGGQPRHRRRGDTCRLATER